MKNINNYKNLYTIDDKGNVFSVDRYNIDKNGKKKFYPGKKLKQETSTAYGHKRVTLSKNGKTKRYLVHRLVGLHFIPNPLNKPQINHIDNNPINNHKDNLEWCTGSENMIHAQKQGRLFDAQSAGGKIGGNIGRQRGIDRIKKSIGTIHNNWQILNYDSPRKALCKCLLCNREYIRDFRSIVLGVSKQCKSCGLKGKNK